jgi:hypothetical protein
MWGDAIPMESWQASPAGVFPPQYMARSAMILLVACTATEKSVFPMPGTSFTLMVLRESGAMGKEA